MALHNEYDRSKFYSEEIKSRLKLGNARTGVPRGGGGLNPEIPKKLGQIPSSVEYKSVTT
jgi:hypothetical protein